MFSFYLDPVMVSMLLNLVCLCLLGARHTVESAGVTQFPNHRVIEKKQAVTLRCDPISGHEALYWYRRAVGKEIKFLVYFLGEDKQDDSGMPNKQFSAERTGGTFSTLNIQHAELEDSGVYFCASSQDTVLQSHAVPVKNHTLLSSRLNSWQL
uniref:Ig-like domain-containing protein n=1 Tax=Equus asinus TaxID=9793 RepID=A0A9L0IY52_EQUAS